MNIASWIRKRAFLDPDAIAIKEGSVQLNNAQLYRQVLQTVSFLENNGIKQGDRVAALLYNSSLFMELFFGCAHLGAILVPLNYRLAGAELNYMMEQSESTLLIADPDFREKIGDAKLTEGSKIIVNKTAGASVSLPLDAKEETVDRVPVEQDVSTDAPLLIMYTSGTTGRPKGATLSHGNVQWNAIMHHTEGFYREKALACAPFFHVAGLNAVATQILYTRGSLVIQKSFDPRQALELIEKEKITCMFGAPTMLDMMAREPCFETTDFSSVRYITAGAAPVPVNPIEKFQQKGVRIRQGYGLTESSPAVCLLHDEHALSKPGSCGKEFFHLEIRIVDENGTDLPQGEVGELIIKGPNVMLGYWRDPEATRETLRDGWLWTGDLAKRDEDGFIYIVDRKKDMIISGGENIYPAEVESVLIQHPDVAEVAVIGIPDEKWGEAPVAHIVLEPGAGTAPEAFIEYCLARIAKYKIPKHFRFVEELPRTATGKVNKPELKQKAQEHILKTIHRR